MANWTRTLEDAARELGLKKSGSQWAGPCPCCGGNDRFWLSKGRTHDILATCRHGCGFGEIAKEMVDRGLMLRDSDYVKPLYTQDDLETANYMIIVIEAMLRNGETLEADDRRAIARLAGRVDPDRKRRLQALLDGVVTV